MTKVWFRFGIIFVVFLLIHPVIGAARKSNTKRLPVRIEGSPMTGNKEAPVTIVEFTDFECPFCEAVQPSIQKILKSYPKEVRLVFKHFPLQLHRNAKRAHLAAACAEEQGRFWEYRNELFQDQRALKRNDLLGYAEKLGLNRSSFEQCLDQETYLWKIQEDIKEGFGIGVSGTPTFLINGISLPGAQSFVSFQHLIEQELSQAKS